MLFVGRRCLLKALWAYSSVRYNEVCVSEYKLCRCTLQKGCAKQENLCHSILVLRDRAPFVQHQASRSLGDFSSICACSESSLANLIGWEYETITLRMLRKLDLHRTFTGEVLILGIDQKEHSPWELEWPFTETNVTIIYSYPLNPFGMFFFPCNIYFRAFF